MHILLFLDYLQKDPLVKHKCRGIFLDEVFVAPWFSDWKRHASFPCVQDVIGYEKEDEEDEDDVEEKDKEIDEEEVEDNALNVFGTVHLLHVSTEK